MGFRSNCGSLLAELRGLSRSLWTYALTAAVVIAPFFIGVQKEKLALTVAASVAFVLALCVLGLAQYDNSILYTDHVLSELHRRFAGGRLLFIYVSDHGQIVSEDHYGSGFLPGYQDEFRTPLLIWTDDAKSIATIHGDLGGSRLNMESFDEMVRFLLGGTPEPRLSTSSTVSVLVPENVRHYKDLAALVPEK